MKKVPLILTLLYSIYDFYSEEKRHGFIDEPKFEEKDLKKV